MHRAMERRRGWNQETCPNQQHVAIVLDMETEGQEESKKIPGFPIKVSQSLSDFMNRNRKVRGGDLVEEKMIESVLEFFSWRCCTEERSGPTKMGVPCALRWYSQILV